MQRSSASGRAEMSVHHLLEEILNEYIFTASLQSANLLGTTVTGRAVNRYNAWAAIRKRTNAAGFLASVGCHAWQEQCHVSHYRAGRLA